MGRMQPPPVEEKTCTCRQSGDMLTMSTHKGDIMAARGALLPAGAMLALLLSPLPAAADAIDGDWCFSDGRRLSIDGPKIVTPGGRRMAGEYDRHGFTYTAPGGEAHAGSIISMAQQDEDTMHLSPGAEKSQVWRRCPPPVS